MGFLLKVFTQQTAHTPRNSESSPGLSLQRKIQLDHQDDSFESDADKKADTNVSSPFSPVPLMRSDHPVAMIRKKGIDYGTAVPPTLVSALRAGKTRGTPLPPETKNRMEPHFQSDFSDVKVHRDSESIQMNRDLHSRAFTYGGHIYFGPGGYNPGTTSGDRLIAHELTHVVQQRGGPGVQQSPGTIVQRDGGQSRESQGITRRLGRLAGRVVGGVYEHTAAYFRAL
jgi:hypothetical protein